MAASNSPIPNLFFFRYLIFLWPEFADQSMTFNWSPRRPLYRSSLAGSTNKYSRADPTDQSHRGRGDRGPGSCVACGRTPAEAVSVRSIL